MMAEASNSEATTWTPKSQGESSEDCAPNSSLLTAPLTISFSSPNEDSNCFKVVMAPMLPVSYLYIIKQGKSSVAHDPSVSQMKAAAVHVAHNDTGNEPKEKVGDGHVKGQSIQLPGSFVNVHGAEAFWAKSVGWVLQVKKGTTSSRARGTDKLLERRQFTPRRCARLQKGSARRKVTREAGSLQACGCTQGKPKVGAGRGGRSVRREDAQVLS